MRQPLVPVIVSICWVVVVGPVQAGQTYTTGPAAVTPVLCDAPRVEGVVVNWRRYDSPLARAGVPVHAVIVEYGRYRITTNEEYIAAVDAYGTRPVDVKVLLPLQRGSESARRERIYSVTAVPKTNQDGRIEPPGRALVFCIVGPNKAADEYQVARHNAACVESSILSDPIGEQARVKIFDEWQEDNAWERVAKALRQFCSGHEVNGNDAVLVYFCGHGGYNPERYQGEGHMLEFNTAGPGDPLAAGKYVWRGALLDTLPRHVRLRGLITESCFTKTSINPDVLGKDEEWALEQREEQLTRTLPSTWQRLLLHSSGVVSLTSCSKNQKAWGDPAPPYLMLFTEALIKASDQPAADWPDFIQAVRNRTSQRFKEVRPWLQPLALAGQIDQVPQIFHDQHRVTTRAVASKGEYLETRTVSVWVKIKKASPETPSLE